MQEISDMYAITCMRLLHQKRKFLYVPKVCSLHTHAGILKKYIFGCWIVVIRKKST